MRRTAWIAAVTGLGLLGAAVALAAGWGWVSPVAVIVPLALVPVSTIALSFIGLARTGAVGSYAVVTLLSVAAPVVDVWSRALVAGDLDSATWLGVIAATTVTGSGVVAGVAERTRESRARVSSP